MSETVTNIDKYSAEQLQYTMRKPEPDQGDKITKERGVVFKNVVLLI